MKCSKFLTGVGSIQPPYFLRIGSSSSSLVIQPAKPGDSWSSDIFWGKGGLGGGAVGGEAVRGENFSILWERVFFSRQNGRVP
jgi:hypothetical protein